MQELWSPPTPAVADAIRSVCQRLLLYADAFADELAAAALTVQYGSDLLRDASLAEEDRDLNRSDLVQWLTANIQHPGRRVEPYIGPRTAAYIRDLGSRGIAPDFAGGWRAALDVAWRRWLEECVEFCSDTSLLIGVLEVSAKSLMQYALDSVAALREASLAASMGNADAEAMALIQLIAGGAPMTEDFAEGRLRYRLSRSHVGLVVWADDPALAPGLDEVTMAVRTAWTSGNTLVARATTASRWMWLSAAETPDLHQVEKVLARAEGIRVAVGRPGVGLAGFRSSHQDALAAQALVIRLGSNSRLTAYADVELIDALTRDKAAAQRFVAKTLGPLAHADAALQEALLTYVQCGFNTTRAAAQLYAHRNTVERRVSRANELSAIKVEDNPAHVAAALLVLHIAPGIAAPADS